MVNVKKEDVIEKFEKCLTIARSEWGPIHKAFNEDKRFIQLGQQLTPEEERKLKGRPMHIINKLLSLVKSVTNEMRQTEIAGKLSPIDNGADNDKAEVRQGVLRGIERMSNAKYAYQYAGEEAVTGGMGAFRINTKYVSDKSFDQTLEIKRILDASTVYYGPANEPDFSDAPWCIIEQKSDKADKFTPEWNRLKGDDVNEDIWGTAELPFEFEFWYLEKIPDTLYRFKIGKSVFKSQLKPEQMKNDDLFVQRDGVRLERKTERKKWWSYKLKADDIVGEPVQWKGKFCPIILVMGREVWVDGRRTLLSLCRYSKASAKMYTYARQEMARRLSQAPKASWLMAIESVPKGLRKMWDSAGQVVHSTLYYNSESSSGKPIPPPQIPQMPSVDQGLVSEAQFSDTEIKDTSGIQNENLAMKSNATSRVAIESKKQEGDTITYDFQDNLAIGVQHCTRVINDLIPKVIDTPRQIRMIGEDDAEKVIQVNEPYRDAKTGEESDIYYLSEEEEYDVSQSVGPNYESKRQEAQENILAVMDKSEAASIVLPHVWVRSLPFPWAKEASKAMRKFVDKQYPGILEPDEEEEEQQPQIPPEVIEKLQEAEQIKAQIPELMKEMEALKSNKDTEMAKIEQQKESDMDKLFLEQKKVESDHNLEQQKVDISRYGAVTDRMDKSNNSDNTKEQQKLSILAKSDNDSKQVQADFQGKMDKMMADFSAKMDKSEPKQILPPINVNVTVPKGGSKTITGPTGTYKVEEDD